MIGTTKNGAARIGQSAVMRGEKALKMNGVKQVTAYTVVCRHRQRIEIWKEFEVALIMVFREQHGEIPKLNGKHKNNRCMEDRFRYFKKETLQNILSKLSSNG